MEKDIYGEEAWQSINKNFDHVKGLYLDHAGSTLYSKSVIEHSLAELTQNCFGNPHSQNIPSKITTDLIDQTRIELLNFFHADPKEYALIFTSGATDSLRLVAESFQFVNESSLNECGSFVYLKESHTSVIGMRECFKSFVPCYALPSDEITTYFHPESGNVPDNEQMKSNFGSSNVKENTNKVCNEQKSIAQHETIETVPSSNSLFVFPAQCNFSGFKYPLELIAFAQENGFSSIKSELCINRQLIMKQKTKRNWFCLLDASSFVGTNQLNLSRWKPDMVALSFYKIFGYPTGLGALIVHRRANHVLQKKYVGGGTVEIVSSSQDFHAARQLLQEKFENGTVNFLGILSLRHGMRELIRTVSTMENVSIHTFQLGQLLYLSLCNLRHANRKSLVKIYSHTEFTDRHRQGAIISFNLLTEKGDYIGYAHVEKILTLYDIHVRTGCFCNPAACQKFLDLSEEDLRSNHKSGHKCGDENDLIFGRPTGAVRVSFGYMSKKDDVIRFVDILRQCFLQGQYKTVEMKPEPLVSRQSNIELSGIYVYPIKSCGAFNPRVWPISKSGLLYDRCWVIVNEAGVALTQKREPKLCMIRPEIDLNEKKLILRCPKQSTIMVDIKECNSSTETGNELKFIKICGKVMRFTECETVVNEWLSKVIGQPALRLLRCSEDRSSLVNESSFLLVNENSVLSLKKQFKNDDSALASTEQFLTRFRGNFVISGAGAFEEDSFTKIKIGPFAFKNSGPCYRCQMVCVDQNTASRNQEALSVLANIRGKKMPFGICLEMCSQSSDSKVIEIGCPIIEDYSE